MKKRLLFFLRYYVFWVLFFVIQKPIFMLWQHALLGDVRGVDWLLVMWHGLPLDLSVAAYVTLFAGLWLCISFWWKGSKWQSVLDAYTITLLAVGVVTMLGDNGCFPSWGYHLDRSVFVYICTPQEVLACAPWYVWLLSVMGFLLLWLISVGCGYACRIIRCHNYGAHRLSPHEHREKRPLWKKVLFTFVMLLVTGLLFLPLRGSVTVSTMNTGRVYFSHNQMLNLAAVNPIFNIMETATENPFDVDRYSYMSTEEATQLVQELLPHHKDVNIASDTGVVSSSLFTTPRPNIILIILESFSSQAWMAMPNMQRLAAEGVFFSNAYASSYRTDRGVVSVLSGYPGQPTSSLMLVPYKSQNLPQLGTSLQREGYQLKFYYGGDEDFTCMRSYLVNGGFNDRVADRDFPVSQRISKWGVPDHYLFNRASNEILSRSSSDNTPTLDVILTLSSHEPFDVDFYRYDNRYLNAIAYTDSCVGAFVKQLQRSEMWNNTVVVMTADHGYPYPEGVTNFEPRRYRIPMLMVGGAVREPREVKTLCSQIDLVPTLLAEMNLPTEDYWFGKNVLDTTQNEFAFYTYNDGFALIVPNDTIVVDTKVNRPILGNNPRMERQVRAMVQRVMEKIEEL